MAEKAIRDRNNVESMMAVDGDTSEINNLRMDDDKGTLRVGVFYWDTDSLTWVRAQQADMTLDEVVEASNKTYYKDQRIEYDGNENAIYLGYHTTLNAETDDTGWVIVKLDYDGNNNVVRRRVQTTSWDDRISGWS